MVEVSSQNNSININVSSGGTSANIEATPDTAQYYSEKAREWAISNRIIDNADYSSKYYAEQSKESETKTENYERSVIEKYNSFVDISNEATNDLETLKNNSVEAIGEAKTNSIIEINNKLNSSLTEIENLTNEKETAINNTAKKYDNLTYKNITNCITSIPQNIKVDIVEDKIYLRAGSVVTIPNGFEDDGVTRKFNYVTLGNDVTGTYNTSNVYLFFIEPNLTYLGGRITSGCYSGDTAPDSPANAVFWYDTKNNIVKRYINSAWTEGWSLPFCDVDSGIIANIFNGFGYIGSHIWIDKGVKYLVPNGRNEDGTLNNIENTTENTVVSGNVHSWSGEFKLNVMLTNAYLNAQSAKRFSINKIIPNSQSVCYSYSEKDNYWYYTEDTGANWTILQTALIGSIYTNSSSLSIQNIQIKKPFRALDYNDKPEITAWGTPSNNYNDLTYGGHGSTYVAPANGFFVIQGYGTENDIYLVNTSTALINSTEGNTSSLSVTGCFMPCKKGDTIKAGYYNGTVTMFRFVFAQGEMA